MGGPRGDVWGALAVGTWSSGRGPGWSSVESGPCKAQGGTERGGDRGRAKPQDTTFQRRADLGRGGGESGEAGCHEVDVPDDIHPGPVFARTEQMQFSSPQPG